MASNSTIYNHRSLQPSSSHPSSHPSHPSAHPSHSQAGPHLPPSAANGPIGVPSGPGGAVPGPGGPGVVAGPGVGPPGPLGPLGPREVNVGPGGVGTPNVHGVGVNGAVVTSLAGASLHGPQRFSEAIDILRQEYDLLVGDLSVVRGQRDEYESKLQTQVNEQNLIRQQLYELEAQHTKVRSQYEEELARLRAEIHASRSQLQSQNQVPGGSNLPSSGPPTTNGLDRERELARERERDRDLREMRDRDRERISHPPSSRLESARIDTSRMDPSHPPSTGPPPQNGTVSGPGVAPGSVGPGAPGYDPYYSGSARDRDPRDREIRERDLRDLRERELSLRERDMRDRDLRGEMREREMRDREMREMRDRDLVMRDARDRDITMRDVSRDDPRDRAERDRIERERERERLLDSRDPKRRKAGNPFSPTAHHQPHHQPPGPSQQPGGPGGHPGHPLPSHSGAHTPHPLHSQHPSSHPNQLPPHTMNTLSQTGLPPNLGLPKLPPAGGSGSSTSGPGMPPSHSVAPQGYSSVPPSHSIGMAPDGTGFLEDLDLASMPPDLKKEGSDWWAVFNPKVKRVLDVSLHQTLMHESVVCCVRFSADGKYLATGCNRTAQIYDVQTGAKTVLIDESGGKAGDLYIRSVCFSPDGKYLATGAEDKQIRIWDIAKRCIRNIFDGHQQEIYSLDFSQDGRLIVSGSGDKTARIWDMWVDGRTQVPDDDEKDKDEKDKNKEALVSKSKVLTINDPDSLNNDAGVTSVAISPNAQFVAAGSLDTVVRIWDANTGLLVERLKGHRDSVYSVAFTPDGKGLVSGSLDKTLKYWDVSSLYNRRSGDKDKDQKKDADKSAGGGSQCTMNFTGHKDYVLSVAVSHDGQYVVSGSKDRGVHFWDAKTAIAQCMLQGHKNSVISIDLSPTGNMLATGSGDWQARIWKYNTDSAPR